MSANEQPDNEPSTPPAPLVAVMPYRRGESYCVIFSDRDPKGGESLSLHEVTREGGELRCYHLADDYTTRLDRCEGDHYRRDCRHLKAVRAKLPAADKVAAQLYARTSARSAAAAPDFGAAAAGR